jgi:hypothetical protein
VVCWAQQIRKTKDKLLVVTMLHLTIGNSKNCQISQSDKVTNINPYVSVVCLCDLNLSMP